MKPTPAQAVELISAHGATQYGLLASDLLDFVEYLEAGEHQLPTLRNAIGSGDSVPVDLHHRFRDVLGWEVMEGAGMTEVGTYYAVNPRYGQRKWGSVGQPAAETRLRIVAERGHDCAIEEVGEILVDSPSSTIGYWQDARATAELLSGGWLHTGDLARMDEDGYVWFVGRKKVMIVRRGSNIAPAEVEDVLDEHPLVHASVVVGVNDPRDGQVPAACVVLLDEGITNPEALLRDYVAGHLAAYKCPVYYLFLDELPRTSTGKFDRHHLLELAQERFAP
jgi:long-chain acyl-CoA synthetase